MTASLNYARQKDTSQSIKTVIKITNCLKLILEKDTKMKTMADIMEIESKQINTSLQKAKFWIPTHTPADLFQEMIPQLELSQTCS